MHCEHSWQVANQLATITVTITNTSFFIQVMLRSACQIILLACLQRSACLQIQSCLCLSYLHTPQNDNVISCTIVYEKEKSHAIISQNINLAIYHAQDMVPIRGLSHGRCIRTVISIITFLCTICCLVYITHYIKIHYETSQNSNFLALIRSCN